MVDDNQTLAHLDLDGVEDWVMSWQLIPATSSDTQFYYLLNSFLQNTQTFLFKKEILRSPNHISWIYNQNLRNVLQLWRKLDAHFWKYTEDFWKFLKMSRGLRSNLDIWNIFQISTISRNFWNSSNIFEYWRKFSILVFPDDTGKPCSCILDCRPHWNVLDVVRGVVLCTKNPSRA